MNCTVLAACFVFTLAGAGEDYPPLPDFEKRIDYVAWLERALSEVDDEENAYFAYAQFMPGLVGSSVSQDDWPTFEGMLTTPRSFDPSSAAGPGDVFNRGPAPWHPKRKSVWQASYKRTRKILKRYDAASGRKKLVPLSGLDGRADNKANLIQNVRFPHLKYLLQCSEGKLETAWRIRKGKVSSTRFLTAVETNLRVANQMRGSIFAAEHFVECKIRTMTYQHARWAFAHGVLKAKHAAKLTKLLRTIDKEPITASPTLKGECLRWLDALQYIYGPLAGGGLKFNGIRYKEVTGQNMGATNRFGLGVRVERDPQGAAKAILEAHVAMEQHMQPGFAMDHHRALGVLADRMRDSNKINKGLMLGLGRDYSRLYSTSANCEAERRATHLVAELFAYKNKKKRWPKTLGKLGKKVPDDIKQDVFRDEPFVYVLLQDGPFLYSVGRNGIDDGGIHDSKMGFAGKGDFVFWPIPDSEERLAASKLNRVPDKDMTQLSAIGPDLEGKRVTIAAVVKETSSRPSKKHERRYSVILSQGDTTIEMIYFQSVADALGPSQEIKPGIRIRARAVVEKKEEAWRLKLEDPTMVAVEE
ncbi:MAG: hypothetical protein MI923_24395 [Phycisphaerales bacterium]|nr:hypothetical protein [Phycisphaerales bacterium]